MLLSEMRRDLLEENLISELFGFFKFGFCILSLAFLYIQSQGRNQQKFLLLRGLILRIARTHQGKHSNQLRYKEARCIYPGEQQCPNPAKPHGTALPFRLTRFPHLLGFTVSLVPAPKRRLLL